ncbi:MAG: BrxA family protein [Bacteroidota bacterium]
MERTPSPAACAQQVYSSRIIKASALIADTMTLLSCWDESLSVDANLRRAREENVFGKGSRSRVEDILQIFRERYLVDPAVARSLVRLVKGGFPSQALVPVLYFFSAKADQLLYDIVAEVLRPMRDAGFAEITVQELCRVLSRWVEEGKTYGKWSPGTVERVAHGVLTTLRDFGVLHGVRKKVISPVYLPTKAFAFIAFELKRTGVPSASLLAHPAWGLFLLQPDGVERLFIEAHQERLLEYHAAGTAIRIDFAQQSLEEYAYALTEG